MDKNARRSESLGSYALSVMGSRKWRNSVKIDPQRRGSVSVQSREGVVYHARLALKPGR